MISLMHDAIAPSTRKVYSAGVRLFKSFCKSHALRHLPASELTIRLFCTSQSTRVSYSTISTYLSAVRMLHLEWGLQDPTADAPLLTLLLQGIKRRYRPNLNSRQRDNSSAPTPCVGFSLPDLPPSSTVLGGFHFGLLRVSPGERIYISHPHEGLALNLTPKQSHPTGLDHYHTVAHVENISVPLTSPYFHCRHQHGHLSCRGVAAVLIA